METARGLSRRVNAISQLKVIEADTADKVKALISRWETVSGAVHVIKALRDSESDAPSRRSLFSRS